jgi:H+/Cl- antiporter ClcA
VVAPSATLGCAPVAMELALDRPLAWADGSYLVGASCAAEVGAHGPAPPRSVNRSAGATVRPTHRCPRCHRVSRASTCPWCGHALTDVPPTPVWHPTVAAALLRDLMRFEWEEHAGLLRFLVRWLVLGSVIGVLAGVSSSVFLYGLMLAIDARLASSWLLYLLPVGGLAVGLAYHYGGSGSAAGNNLILDEIHGLAAETPEPDDRRRWLPRRLAPLVLVGTWITHLLGGSAGREGTAIQMSGSLSDGVARLVGLRGEDRRLVLIAAVSGGFASVFSVPLAGAVFGLEVQSVGRVRYDALVPALTAAMVGNVTFHALDLPHDVTPHLELAAVPLSLVLLGKVAVAALAFGLVSVLFSELVEGIKRAFAVVLTWPPLRPTIGGLLVVGLTFLVGSRDYLGLSLPLIDAALRGADVVWYAFALKLLFTTVTLGAGFQGGEVTPLFVIGATLGATLAGVLGVPVELLAAVGFVAVFAAATNTPLACTIMGLELFGAGGLPYLAVGCVVAYVFSSHRGIYGSQRIDTPKGGVGERDVALRDMAERRSGWLARRRP